MIQREVGANWLQAIAAIARSGKPEIGKPKTLVSQFVFELAHERKIETCKRDSAKLIGKSFTACSRSSDCIRI